MSVPNFSYIKDSGTCDVINRHYFLVGGSSNNNQMSNPEINKVVNMVKKEHKSLLQSIQQFITDTKLLNYLLAALITYICRNYNKYKDVIDEKTDQLVEDMRKNLPWVLENFFPANFKVD